MKLCQMLIVSSVLLFAFCDGLQCGSRTCGGDNACCSDARLGPTCYDPLDNVCTSNGASGYTLCGEGEQACGSVCFQPQNYFCCSGQLMQKGQTCTSATTAAPTSAPKTPAPANNCPGAANQAGINCPAGTTCCGAGTITPSCINNTDTSVECCVYFLSSTQCPAGSVCGGSLGAGASSDAQCGPAGSTFCNAGFNENAFCTAGEVCCTGTGNAFCCPAGNTCGTSYDEVCIAPTAAPTKAAPAYNCIGASDSVGLNCPAGTSCCGAGTITPSCINNTDTSVKCCTYFLSSTQCAADATCGGILGPGASSDAQCGPAGSTFCDAGFNLNTFCTASEVCCTAGGTGFCCPSGKTCGTSNGSCI